MSSVINFDFDFSGLSDSQKRLFAIRCARRVQHLMTDPRSLAALDVAERHAKGEATDAELDAAESAAEDAAHDASKAADVAQARFAQVNLAGPYQDYLDAAESEAWAKSMAADAAFGVASPELDYVSVRYVASQAACAVSWSARAAAWPAEMAMQNKILNDIRSAP